MPNFSEWLESKYLSWQIKAGSRSTLSDFAKFLGISRVSLSQYLHEERNPSDSHLIKIAAQLGDEVYETLQEQNSAPARSFRRFAYRYARYWPYALTVIITVSLFEISTLFNTPILSNDLQSTGELTPLGQDYSATAEAARILVQGTVQAVQTQRKGACDVFEPGTDLRLCDLSGRNMSQIDLAGANFQGAILNGTDFSNSNLSGADLTGASLISSILTSADLSGATLVGVDLSDANLEYANLTGANLMGANMRGADLTWVNFTQAILVGADLSDCNLLNSILDIDQLASTFAFDNALLPLNLR